MGEQWIRDLDDRIEQVARAFDVRALARERFPLDAVVEHYRQSDLGYRFLHSRAGAVHLALNFDGRFDRRGYAAHAGIVAACVDRAPGTVLELGCGRGYNLARLAACWPRARLAGVDITPTHLAQARASDAAGRAGWLRADFHDLPLDTHSVDLVFEIESVCHATDPARVLAEARRVLRPGGRLVCLDGFETAHASYRGHPVVRRACRLVEASLAVDGGCSDRDWSAAAAAAGLQPVRDDDLTHAILPNLRRFERLCGGYFALPGLSRAARALAPERMNRIAIAGLLIPPLVRAGIYGYRLMVWEAA
jgi:SAM-dependent methyltransferase